MRHPLLPRVSQSLLLSPCCILIPATLQGSYPCTSFSPLLPLHYQQPSAHQFNPSYCISALAGQLPSHVHTRHHAPTRRTPSLHTAPHGVPARNRRHRPCRVPPGNRERVLGECVWVCVNKVWEGVGRCGLCLLPVSMALTCATHRWVTRGGFVPHPLHPPHPPHPPHLPRPTRSPCLSIAASLSIPPSLPPPARSP